MYRSPLLNKAIIPSLAVASLAYALYATGAMRPRVDVQAPLSAPPQKAFAHSVAAVGLVEPASELVSVAPRVAGWIRTVHVSAGQTIKAGDPLFSLDDSDLRAELALRQQSAKVAEARLERLRHSPRPEDVPVARAAVDEARAVLGDAETKLELLESAMARDAATTHELHERRWAVDRAKAQMRARQAELDRLLSGAWSQDVRVAEEELAMSKVSVARIEADLDRLVTRSPIDAVVLRLTARAGQYAPTGLMEEPLATLGSPGALHIRADVNEADVPRVGAGSEAVAMVRGESGKRVALTLVRVEPLVTPKKALSGFAPERVDTRVMQVIYRVSDRDATLLVGQQVDLYINSEGGGKPLAARTGLGG